MTSQRVRDRLVGAGIGVVAVTGLLVVTVAVILAGVSEPVGASSGTREQQGSPGEQPVVPPDDLAEGETWFRDLTLQSATVVLPDSRLLNVRADGRDVRLSPGEVLAGTLEVEATVPFDMVAEELGGDATVAAAPDGEASVTRTFVFAGRQWRAAATGAVSVSGGRIVVEPTEIDIGGPEFLGESIGALAAQLVTIQQEVRGLPEGLVLQEVAVIDSGFRADLLGSDVRLVP